MRELLLGAGGYCKLELFMEGLLNDDQERLADGLSGSQPKHVVSHLIKRNEKHAIVEVRRMTMRATAKQEDPPSPMK